MAGVRDALRSKLRLGSVSIALRRVSWALAWLCAPALSSLPKRRSEVLAVTPAPPGSFGDEVILRGFVNGLGQDPRRINFVEPSQSRNPGWAVALGTGRQAPALSSRLAGIAHLPLLSRTSHVYVLGADVLDGYYSIERSRRRIQFARLAARAGSKVSIVSYSLNESPSSDVMEEWRRLPSDVRLVARDPLSQLRTEEIMGRPAILGADLAFLASAHSQTSDSLQQGSVCVVPNSSLHQQYGGFGNLATAMTNCVRALLSSPSVTSVTLVPHDLRNGETTGDIALCRAVLEAMKSEAKRPSLEVPTDALQARQLLGSADVVVSARMHAAIGALCESRPVLLVGYQGKAQGLLQAFELESALLPQDIWTHPKALLSSVESTIQRVPEIHATIGRLLPRVIDRPRAVFA